MVLFFRRDKPLILRTSICAFIFTFICFGFVSQCSAQDIVLYASEAPVKVGSWSSVGDASAAGGSRLANPDAGQPKVVTPAANPASYVELSFFAYSGQPYHLWMRGKAQGDSPYNDSTHVQFSGSVTSTGSPIFRIGTTSSTEFNLEDCMGCTVQGWGWQDNGWGIGVLGPNIYFESTGTQTIRIQVREDGLSLDQIVLSPSSYLTQAPGALKNDTVILARSGPTPPPTPGQESPNNTRVPPATQIVDSAGGVWTRTANGTILRNAAGTGGAGSQILYCNRIVYAFGNDSQWWRWSNGWSPTGPVDPCSGGTPTPTPTPQGNQPPQVSLSASPTSGSSPLFVSFSSSASDSDGSIASYSWNFADGSTSNLANPTHTFQLPGVYVVYLQVMDNLGATTTKAIQINVGSPPPPSGSTQLRVLSWNINFGTGTDGITNFDRTTTRIANINPDVVGLCEVPVDAVGTIVSLLNQKTGRSWSYYYVAKWAGYTEGNLILSKYSFVSTNLQYLSYSRSVAEATINVGGRTVSFFATHLDPDSSSVRYQQAGELMSFASNFSESRIIVGDFNAGPDTSESIRMTGGYYDSWMQAMAGGTAVAYPDNPVWAQTRTRRGRIDYVFYSLYSGNLFLKGTQIPDMRDLSNPNVTYVLGTLDDKGVRPSDHNPMIATFDLR